MRILHTVEFYSPSVGGSQEVVRQISERLAARGHEVTVATTRLPQRAGREIAGVRIAEFEARGNEATGMTGEIDRYRAFVRDGGFDIVMSYAAQQWATDALLPIVEHIDAVRVLSPCGFSGLRLPEYAGFFERLPQRMAHYDSLVFHSPTYQDMAFARRAGLGNVTVIPNGADDREFALSADERRQRRERFRRQHGIGDHEPLLLTVGTHTGAKGHSLVLDALVQMPVRRATLALIGNATLGHGCTTNCRVRAGGVRLASLGRHRALLLDPPRDGVLDAYFAADLFVFGSRTECSPLVLYEAAAAGLPFVTVPSGNSAEIARWTGAGVVIPAQTRPNGVVLGRSRDMAREATALLRDHERRLAMGAAGRAAWEARYSWDRVTDRYEELYRTLHEARSA